MSVIVKNKYVYLFIGHIVLFTLFFLYKGESITNEGDKYISEVKVLLGHDISYLLKYQLFNLSYFIYLIPFIAFGIPVKIIILITHGLSLLSYYAFSSFVKKRYGERVSYYWLAFTMLCPVIIYWNLNLFAASFFMSVSLLFITSVFKLNKFSIFYGIILFFTRPLGIFIIALAALLKWIYFDDFSLKRTLIGLCVLLFGGFIFIFFFLEPHFENVTKEILGGSVICGFPKHTVPVEIISQMSLFEAYKYYVSAFGYQDLFLTMLQRFISYFNMTRPFYSTYHNAVNIICSLFFITNLIALFKVKRYFNEILFVHLFILINCVMVMLFCNELTERYTLLILPYLFLSTALYIDHLRKKKRNLI